jgi:hypothetical protein
VHVVFPAGSPSYRVAIAVAAPAIKPALHRLAMRIA